MFVRAGEACKYYGPWPETVYHTHVRMHPHNFLRYMSCNLHVFGTDGNIVAVFEDVRYEAIVQKTLHSESTLHDRVDETAHTANHKLSLTELLNCRRPLTHQQSHIGAYCRDPHSQARLLSHHLPDRIRDWSGLTSHQR